jgi:hypothetical protein
MNFMIQFRILKYNFFFVRCVFIVSHATRILFCCFV